MPDVLCTRADGLHVRVVLLIVHRAQCVAHTHMVYTRVSFFKFRVLVCFVVVVLLHIMPCVYHARCAMSTQRARRWFTRACISFCYSCLLFLFCYNVAACCHVHHARCVFVYMQKWFTRVRVFLFVTLLLAFSFCCVAAQNVMRITPDVLCTHRWFTRAWFFYY